MSLQEGLAEAEMLEVSGLWRKLSTTTKAKMVIGRHGRFMT